MNVELLPTEWVYKYNTHEPHHYSDWKEFKSMISINGITSPLILSVNVINKTLELTEGTHRIHAAHELGINKVPVVVHMNNTKCYKFFNNKIKNIEELSFMKPSNVFMEKI